MLVERTWLAVTRGQTGGVAVEAPLDPNAPTFSADDFARMEATRARICAVPAPADVQRTFTTTYALLGELCTDVGERLRVVLIPDEFQVDDALAAAIRVSGAAFDRELPSGAYPASICSPRSARRRAKARRTSRATPTGTAGATPLPQRRSRRGCGRRWTRRGRSEAAGGMIRRMRTQDLPPQQITNLHGLNTALMRLKPSITGIDLSMFQLKGVSAAMLDAEIAANQFSLYDSLKRGDLLAALKPGLTARVATHPIAYAYDPHGDKHFEGGPAGTKFSAAKGVVNPFLQQKVAAHLGRIRRHANGKTKTYYLSEAPNQYTKGMQLAVQVDYEASPVEKITYHGYPRDVVAYVLSETLGGAPIPV